MVTMDIDSYILSLKYHDWYYMHSDDGRVYREGVKNHQELLETREAIDPDHTIYNMYAPDAFKTNRGDE